MDGEYSRLASLVGYMTPEGVHQVSSEGDYMGHHLRGEITNTRTLRTWRKLSYFSSISSTLASRPSVISWIKARSLES